MENVLELMLHSYAFMVSGLFVPVLGMLFLKKPSSLAAISTMLIGGTTTLSLIIIDMDLPFGIDPNFYGISAAGITFLILQKITSKS